MFRVECIPSLRRRLCVPALRSPPFPTGRRSYMQSVHTSHACLCVAARGRRKCGLIYSRHLLWEHSPPLLEINRQEPRIYLSFSLSSVFSFVEKTRDSHSRMFKSANARETLLRGRRGRVLLFADLSLARSVYSLHRWPSRSSTAINGNASASSLADDEY